MSDEKNDPLRYLNADYETRKHLAGVVRQTAKALNAALTNACFAGLVTEVEVETVSQMNGKNQLRVDVRVMAQI